MTNGEKYFATQMESSKFKKEYENVSEQIDIEWELERVKNQIQNNAEKNTIIKELEKLQSFVHSSMFVRNKKASV